MPLYEYSCKKCGHRFEVWHPARQSRGRRCPACNNRAHKVFHPVGIIFKGSGFHTTDYCRKDSSVPCPKEEKEPSSCPAKSAGEGAAGDKE